MKNPGMPFRSTILSIAIGLAISLPHLAMAEEVEKGQFYDTPEMGGWVELAISRDGRSGSVALASARLEVIGVDEEFGAMCIVVESKYEHGTPVRRGDYVWIETARLLAFPDRVADERDSAFRRALALMRIMAQHKAKAFFKRSPAKDSEKKEK